MLAGQMAGWLGMQADPLVVRTPRGTPFRGNKYDAGGAPLDLPSVEDAQALSSRRVLLEQLQEPLSRSAATETHNVFRQRAFDLLVSPQVRRAFDLNREPTRVSEAYGDHILGQSVLFARRLIEAGVPIVTVMCGFDNLSDPMADHWDTHHNNFNRLRNTMLPLFDRVFPALLDDLEDRGMLDETLIAVIGDFGRTPKVNSAAGRDHHPYCNSVTFAGGGVRGGQVHGSSDSIGAYPKSSPCGPHNLHATIFHALGIPLNSELRDQFNRPHVVCSQGQSLPLF